MSIQTYCTLVIRSNNESSLPNGFFLTKTLSKFDFTDNASPERMERIRRFEKLGMRRDTSAPRYCWQLATEHRVKATEIQPHFNWVTAQLRRDARLSVLNQNGFECLLGVFWGDQGFGGGPTFAPDFLAALAWHGIPIEVSFYAGEEWQSD
jgi:hypothetical protein